MQCQDVLGWVALVVFEAYTGNGQTRFVHVLPPPIGSVYVVQLVMFVVVLYTAMHRTLLVQVF